MSIKIILVTCPSMEVASELARALVQARLAACVNIVPGIESVYFWDNQLQQDREVLLIIKSTSAKVLELEEQVQRLHPYTVPEFVVLEPGHVAEFYGRWILDYLG